MTIASIARDESTGDIYLGGSFTNGDIDPDRAWQLSIFHFPANFLVGAERFATQIKLTPNFSGTCDPSANTWGHIDENDAPYVSHLGHMYLPPTDSYQIFGLAQAHNFDKFGHMRSAYVFRLQMSGEGVLSDDSSNFHIVQLDGSGFSPFSRFLGMKQQLHYNGGRGIQVRCIVGDFVIGSLTFLIVNSDSGGLRSASVIKSSAGGKYIGMQSVLIGKEKYWVGGVDHMYRAF